ncbi:hypothetical protein FKW77_001548 [Venturia effusa]|uniref:Uncharacterized protein n=1 Tax=Venturia effusa TaxID=50376 RepID=A0A517LBV7_9PEZI|nr:hypothetical protein FKW77_001548 [Venturia effusa]
MPIIPFQHIGASVGSSVSYDVSQTLSTMIGMPPMLLQRQQPEDDGGPYEPPIWLLGGHPDISVDVLITAVFLALFLAGAATHMTILQRNKKRRHKFLLSGLLFGFCMARIVTCIMRIAWTTHVTNISLGLAAQIFVSAGVVLLYVVNLVFVQRLIRASHPRLGWNPIFGVVFKALYVLIPITIIMLITVTIQSYFTLDEYTRRIDRDIQLYGATCFAIISFLPIPMVYAMLTVPRSSPLDKFGRGKWRTKIFVLLAGAILVCFGAAYRCGTSWRTPVPLTQPMPNYFHRAAFYIAYFGVEVLTVFLYAIFRVDMRFYVPNGASKRRSYIPPPKTNEESTEEKSEGTAEADDKNLRDEDKRKPGVPKRSLRRSRGYSEEETFDDQDVLPAFSEVTRYPQGLPLSTTFEDEESDYFVSPRPTIAVQRSTATSRRTSTLSAEGAPPVFM